MNDDQTPSSRRGRRVRRILMAPVIAFVAFVVAGMTVWGALFLRLHATSSEPLSITLACLFAISTVASFVLLKRRWRTLGVFLIVFIGLVVWYLCIPPLLDRQWATEWAVLPTATVKDNLVELRNIRNFDYRTQTDFTPRYYDKTFDLDKLESVDMICAYWASPTIAHIIASFGFGGDNFVAFSIEMRREKGETSSMLRSFFRHYELIYVVADERDVIRLRTNYRQPTERVHIYRVRLPTELQRRLFLSYVAKINVLARRPEWYNTLEDNCTTGVLQRTRTYKGRGRYNWKLLLSGYAAEYAYGVGMLDTRMPFAELREQCLVNAKAKLADTADNFSLRIRDGIPLPAPYTMEEFQSGR